MARAADEASRAVDAELKGSLLRPVLADSLADMLLQISRQSGGARRAEVMKQEFLVLLVRLKEG